MKVESHTPLVKVVLIEDEKQIRRFVTMALEAEHCQVHEADSAKRGLIEVGTRRPDLVILDLGLPDGDRYRGGERRARLVQRADPDPVGTST